MEVTMERWDPHAARWRLMCHRHAAQRLMDGQTPRRVAPVPAPDAGHAAGGRSGGWGAGVGGAGAADRAGAVTALAELSAALGVTVTGVQRRWIHVNGRHH